MEKKKTKQNKTGTKTGGHTVWINVALCLLASQKFFQRLNTSSNIVILKDKFG